jgi:hypothetical protein
MVIRLLTAASSRISILPIASAGSGIVVATALVPQAWSRRLCSRLLWTKVEE